MIKMVNAALQNFIFTVWVNCVVVFLVLIFCLLGIIFGEPVELSLLIKIIGIILLSVWGLYFVVSIATYKTVIITKDKIVVKKYGRELWSLDSNDLKECRCSQITGEFVVMPFVRSMEFIVKGIDDDCAMWKNKKNYYHRCVIGLSVKNAKKMAEMGYNVSFPTPNA